MTTTIFSQYGPTPTIPTELIPPPSQTKSYPAVGAAPRESSVDQFLPETGTDVVLMAVFAIALILGGISLLGSKRRYGRGA